jgi:hypothetical protein
MATAPISYGSEYGTDSAAIERARKYAELMQQQSLQPTEQQTAGGWVIPTSWTQGLAKAAQGIAGAYGQRKADEKEKALATKYQTDLADVIKRGTAAQSGTPERSFQTPANEMGDEAATQRIPATQADPGAAAGIYMSHPATQQLGMQLAQQNAQRQQWAQLLGGAPGATPGAPQGAAPQSPSLLSGTGIDERTAQAMLLADPTGKTLTEAIAKARYDLNKPHISANGQVVQYQQLPDGTMGFAPGRGAVAAAQQFADVMSPMDRQKMDIAAAEQFDKTGRDLPGYIQGRRAAPQAQQPQLPPELAGLPPAQAQAIMADMQKTGTQNANFRLGPSDASGPVAPQNIRAGTIGRLSATPTGTSPADQRAIDKKMGEKLNDLTAEEIISGYKASQKAADQLSSIQESRKAIAGGAFQGAGAGAKTDIAKFAKGVFGIDLDPTKTANSDYLRSTLGSQVLNWAKALGSNPSNADAKRIDEIVGNIDKDPGALNELLDWQEQIVRKSVAQHNSNVDQMEKRGYRPPIDYRVQLPEPTQFESKNPGRRESDKTPVKRYNPATGKIE